MDLAGNSAVWETWVTREAGVEALHWTDGSMDGSIGDHVDPICQLLSKIRPMSFAGKRRLRKHCWCHKETLCRSLLELN